MTSEQLDFISTPTLSVNLRGESMFDTPETQKLRLGAQRENLGLFKAISRTYSMCYDIRYTLYSYMLNLLS